MKDAKPVGIPLAPNLKLGVDLCPYDDKEKDEMKTTPYALALGILMYPVVCTRP